MRIYTIGFTKKSAEEFFGLLKESGAKRVVDVRLSNASQLAGFSKKEDLKFFLREICGMDYVHLPELAPSPEIFAKYKGDKNGPLCVSPTEVGEKRRIAAASWEKDFLKLLSKREVEESVPRKLLDNAVLLCSEPTPEHCHRRLVAEYLTQKWGGVDVVHL